MHTTFPLSRKLNRCPHCGRRHRRNLIRRNKPVQEQFPEFIAELRRDFRYDARPEQAFLEAG